MRGYRTGCKKNETFKIKQMALEGKTVEEISRALLVDPKCIQSFYDHYMGAEKEKAPPVKRTRKRKKVEVPEPPPIPDESDA